MLEALAANQIIVGAYTDRRGGVCPMLAAHRNGGRTDLSSFARAWDRYTGARGRPRAATERELNTLRAMLEASLAIEEVPELPRRAPARVPAPDTGERDRTARAARPARAGPGCGPSGASTSTSARWTTWPGPSVTRRRRASESWSSASVRAGRRAG